MWGLRVRPGGIGVSSPLLELEGGSVLVGTHTRQLDAKGRVAIPADFLNKLEPGDREEIYVAPGEHGCVWLLPKSYFETVSEQLEDLDGEEVSDLFFHYVQSRAIDGQSRIRLDATARAFAEIPDPSEERVSVVICGSGRYLQVWEKGDYERRAPGPRAFARKLKRLRRRRDA